MKPISPIFRDIDIVTNRQVLKDVDYRNVFQKVGMLHSPMAARMIMPNNPDNFSRVLRRSIYRTVKKD